MRHRRLPRVFRIVIAAAFAICAVDRGTADGGAAAEAPATWTLRARVVATGLLNANGIRQVGRFHSGGPLTTNPDFLLHTQAGHVLDPQRVLVALEHNLGAQPASGSHAAGSVLSIDPRPTSSGLPLVVPADLALRPAGAEGGALLVYTTQSQRYANRSHNPGARTAGFTAASGPRYLSINNAFGRPWIANAPFGLRGDGSESVVDPDGKPLANAPSDDAGGVFAGAATPRESVAKGVRSGWLASMRNRTPSTQLTPGAIDHGAFGTALLGPSPDGSGFAVFAIVTGAGAIVQAHVQDGIDGLAPAGTISVGGNDPGLIGIAFKWNPTRVLFVADALRNRIVLVHLGDDTRHFTALRTSHIDGPWLRQPVDLAAAMPEVANPRFASHTTLAGDSDLYVVNRGDGSLLRIGQDGHVVARASIELPGEGRIGANRLRAIAVSADAQRLWVIAQQPTGNESMLLEVEAFDFTGAFGGHERPAALPAPASTAGSAAMGAQVFGTAFTPAMGLGPLFNARSCVACHPGPGGSSTHEEHFARRVARMDPVTGRIVKIDGQASASMPRFSTQQMGQREAPPPALPREANVVSLRMPLPLFGIGRLDEIPDAVIEAQAVSKGDGIKGRVHHVAGPDGSQHVGRYGWKADIVTLDDMVAEAFSNEMGIHSALAPHARTPVKDDGTLVRQVSAFLRGLGRPQTIKVAQ